MMNKVGAVLIGLWCIFMIFLAVNRFNKASKQNQHDMRKTSASRGWLFLVLAVLGSILIYGLSAAWDDAFRPNTTQIFETELVDPVEDHSAYDDYAPNWNRFNVEDMPKPVDDSSRKPTTWNTSSRTPQSIL